MPRSSSSSRSRSQPTRVTHAPVAQRPQPIAQIPTLGQTLKEGFAFGAGSAAAHAVVGSIFGQRSTPEAPPTIKKVQSSTPDCYTQCMKDHSNDYELCKMFIEDK